MDKILITVLLVVAGILASSIVVNTVVPSVQRVGGDVIAMSSRMGDRLRSDIRIVEVSAGTDSSQVQVWIKNTGASTISNPERMDVFFGEVRSFSRLPPCVQTSGVPPCWELAIENDVQWAPYATARLTITLPSPLQGSRDYVITIVLPSGVVVSKVFPL